MSVERTASGLAYERTGSGPALLLIHPGIADRTMWDPQWRRWAEKFSLIRYDQRGFGASADPAGEYSLHGDALEVLDAVGAPLTALVGASMGGGAAIDLVLSAPQRVCALVAVVATPSGWEHSGEHLARFEEIDAVLENEGIDAANELELRMWVDGVRRASTDVEPRVREAVSRVNRGLLERQGGFTEEPQALDPPALGRLHEIEVPTLVVTGALDQPSINAGAAALAAGTAAASAEIASTAHIPSLERPEEFDRVVLPFLEANAA